MARAEEIGKVITVCGLAEPAALGAVMMHEHLHSDIYDWKTKKLIEAEKPMTAERRELLMREAAPWLKKCTEFGCRALIDVTMPPWRAWPTFYGEISQATGMHIVLATGFYREVEMGKYWVKTPDDQIWPFVRQSPVEQLEEMCVREILEGIHGTKVRAGVVKLGTSQARMTPTEIKTFRAGARAQKKTGVHITTHCTMTGAETSQLTILDDEGVDLARVVIGHTAWHLMDPACRQVCIQWMRAGVNFLPTNLACGTPEQADRWQSLIDAFKEIFDLGLGERLVLGLDWAFCSESDQFGACTFMPGPPYAHMFTHTLPAFRRLGLSAAMEEQIMVKNPQRIVPVR